MTKINFKDIGFIYKFWYRIFSFIENTLPFNVVRKIIFKKTKDFPEKWVVFNLILSVLTMFAIHHKIPLIGIEIILYYSYIRILEIIIYQINILIFHPYKALFVEKKDVYRIQNPYRSVVLLGHNLVEVVFWFTAMISSVFPTSDRLIIKIMDNTIRIFTLNYQKVAAEGHFIQILFFLEVICGLLLTIISLAKFVGELPHIYLTNEE
jgi:hypothetical protein